MAEVTGRTAVAEVRRGPESGGMRKVGELAPADGLGTFVNVPGVDADIVSRLKARSLAD